MKIKILYPAAALALLAAGCSVTQSFVKSTFPYKAVLVIPRSSPHDVDLSVSGTASSFDESFVQNTSNADKIHDVHVVSARLQSDDPSDFNIGNLDWVKVYVSKADSSDEVLVASRTDISPHVGTKMVLDIADTTTLDEQVRDPKMRIRFACRLHNHIDANAHLRLVFGITSMPGKK